MRVTQRGPDELHFTSQYGNHQSPEFVTVSDAFAKGVGEALRKTVLSPK